MRSRSTMPLCGASARVFAASGVRRRGNAMLCRTPTLVFASPTTIFARTELPYRKTGRTFASIELHDAGTTITDRTCPRVDATIDMPYSPDERRLDPEDVLVQRIEPGVPRREVARTNRRHGLAGDDGR